jgi:DNA-binding HxlR family transcriptional regulator
MKQAPAPSAARMVEDVIGCKWSLSVIACVRDGVRRPGAMAQRIAGISTKVLNERLGKLRRYGILEKIVFDEKPLHTEYRLTPFGRRFVSVLDRIERLERELSP